MIKEIGSNHLVWPLFLLSIYRIIFMEETLENCLFEAKIQSF